LPTRRYGDRARELFPHNHPCKNRHAATAIFGWHVELPDAQLFRAALEALEILRLDLLAIGALALDRDQLVVHEAPQDRFEESQLFRHSEIHRPKLPPRPPATTRARRRRPRPWRLCPVSMPWRADRGQVHRLARLAD